MPLFKSKSKKAFEHNVTSELAAGKPKPQALAIAYSVKKKPKMATGGIISAKAEKRPMPSETTNDAKNVSQNSAKKPLTKDGWLDRSTVVQAQASPKPKLTALNRSKMAPSSTIKAHPIDSLGRRLDEEEQDLNVSDASDGYKNQPRTADNEEEADKSGPSSPDLKLKKMAKGGMINNDVSMRLAEKDDQEDPKGLTMDDDEKAPSMHEVMSNKIQMLAAGGLATEHDEHPDEEEMIEHAADIAAAIMARRKMASGGGVSDAIEDNNMEQPNGYYPQNEDYALDWDMNEDINSLYQPEDSNLDGDKEESDSENDHDDSVVSKIRRSMKKRSPISR